MPTSHYQSRWGLRASTSRLTLMAEDAAEEYQEPAEQEIPVEIPVEAPAVVSLNGTDYASFAQALSNVFEDDTDTNSKYKKNLDAIVIKIKGDESDGYTVRTDFVDSSTYTISTWY